MDAAFTPSGSQDITKRIADGRLELNGKRVRRMERQVVDTGNGRRVNVRIVAENMEMVLSLLLED